MARKPKDWDKIVRDFEEEEKMAGVPPSENEFFHSLYANADDDARRAMVKSMQQSHGTKLIMNWNEVKDGDVNPYEDGEVDRDIQEKSMKSGSGSMSTRGPVSFTREDLERMRASQGDEDN